MTLTWSICSCIDATRPCISRGANGSSTANQIIQAVERVHAEGFVHVDVRV